jgi:hypothetical protein
MKKTRARSSKPSKPSLRVVSPSTPTGQQSPRKLGQHGSKLWHAITTEYDISDAAGIEILMQVCEVADRVELLAERINRDGEIVVIKGIARANPLIADEYRLRGFICRGLNRLGLDLEPVKAVGRPGMWSR